MSSRRLEYVFGEATLGRAEPHLDESDGRHAAQPWRRQRRTAAAGHCAVKLITRTRDPFERSISACEQISSSMSATSISVVGRPCKVLGISPGQMRHAEPSLSSTRWLLSCLLICIADLPYNRSEQLVNRVRAKSVPTGGYREALEQIMPSLTAASPLLLPISCST